MNATYRDFRTAREQNPPGFRINGSNCESQVSEEEIRAALAALRKPSPIGRPPPLREPPAFRSATPWVLGIVLGVILGISLATRRQAGTIAPVTNTDRAPVSLPAPSPAAPRAQWVIGSQQLLTLPQGNTLATVFKGYLSDVSQLPLHGSQIGDMWAVGNNFWILSPVAGTSRVGWVDPPADEQVATQFSAEPLQVRRAKKVVPRAQLVKQ